MSTETCVSFCKERGKNVAPCEKGGVLGLRLFHVDFVLTLNFIYALPFT